ncbi:MAG: alpha/beta hydrolase [Casimicrobium sp.]
MTDMRNLLLLCLLSLSVGCHVHPQQQASLRPPPEPEPVRLSATQVIPLPAAKTGRKYELWVAYPAGYDAKKKYPVVFVLDAGYAFPLVRSIRNLLGQQGRNIEDFILVGLPPETGLSSKDSRSRDYTISDPLLNANNDPADYSAPKYGEAELFREYLETQVIPYALKELNADPQKLVFVGHSYGGLFGAYVLLTKPRLFNAYILGSPSLWFNKHDVLRYEKAYAQSGSDLPARVMMYAGEFETFGATPRHFKTTDLVGSMRSFEAQLKRRNYPSLEIRSQVLSGEDHLTIFPTLVSRGLLWALPGFGPYSSG